MLAKRIIIVLTFLEGVLFRTKKFRPDTRYTDKFIDNTLVDEIVLIDVSYTKNNRKDLLDVEQKEFDLLSTFLPKQLSEEETKKICSETISKLGAQSIKEMGKVIGELKKQYPDDIDFAKAGPMLKDLLNK